MNQEDTGKKRERDGQSGRGGKRGKGGWKKKNYGQKREFRQNKPNVWRQDNGGRLNSNHQLKPGEETNSYKLIPWELENAAFEEYYKGQQIMGEEEWETFMQTLRTQLPATFRINGTANFAKLIHHKLENDILQKMSSISTPSLTEEGKPAKKIIVEGEELEPLKKLSWYPNGYGWQMHYSRNQLRKLPVLQEFHEFLKRENEAGNITRQEAASMIPPFFMDVKPESRILDVCAAPGSKTFQLLEMVHAEQGKEPSGYVVANDSDAKRCNLLTHQTKRMCSPALIITNHEGEKFPHIVGLDGDQKNVIFDRILCDVPCSGDGTLRKAPDLWRRWNTGMGIALHKVQVKIVLKAAELLEIGGRLVYSTCSLNPIENEAVVAELLRKTQGALELIDVSNELPKLKRRPGMKKWRVQERGNWLESMPEEDDLTAPSKTNTLQSMYANEESDQMPLERCCRILPHDDNTGGFFISVFRKTKRWSRISGLGDENKGVKSVPQNVEKSEAVQEGDCKPDCQANTQEEGGDTNGTKEAEEVTPRPRRNYRFRGIDPVVHVKDEEILTSLKDFYGIGSSFPINEQLFSRTPSGAQPKRLYFISGSVKSVLDKDYFEKLRITSTGVKVSNAIMYEIQQAERFFFRYLKSKLQVELTPNTGSFRKDCQLSYII